MSTDGLYDVRRTYLTNAQAELRRPPVVAATCLMFAALALLPISQTGRAIVGVSVAQTAIWAGAYILLATIGCVWFRRSGLTRSFVWFSAVESAVWLHGVILLGGLSGKAESPWLILAMLGFVFLAGSGRDPGTIIVVLTAPIVAAAAYLHVGRASAVMACALTALGATAFWIIGNAVDRFLREQAQREALQKRVVRLERELDRQHIARDLHDSLGSTLALIGMYASLVERHAEQPEQLRRLSSTLRETSQAGLDELRGLLDAVAPADATIGGLAASLGRVAQRALVGTRASLELRGPPDLSLDVGVRIALVRVFQEALANAVRHGQARTIATELAVVADRVVLSIRDDGTGFDPATIEPGRGLAGMRARAAELGGELRLEAAPRAGARVHFEVPRHRAQSAA